MTTTHAAEADWVDPIGRKLQDLLAKVAEDPKRTAEDRYSYMVWAIQEAEGWRASLWHDLPEQLRNPLLTDDDDDDADLDVGDFD